MYRLRRAILLPILVALITSQAIANESLRVEVVALLEVGLKPTQQGLKQARLRYDRARKISPSDVRVPYAFALVLHHHRKLAEAEKLLDEINRRNAGVLPAWHLRMRNQVLAKDHAGALKTIDQLARRFPDTSAIEDPLPKYLRSAELIGRLFGYLEGPATPVVPVETIRRYEQVLAGRLTKPYMDVLNGQRRAVLNAYEQNRKAANQQRAEDKANEEEEKGNELNRAAEKRERIATRRGEMTEYAAKIESSMQGQVRGIDEEAAPHLKRYNELMAESNRLRRNISGIQRSISAEVAANSEDEQRGRSRERRLREELRRYQRAHREVRDKGITVQRELVRLKTQRDLVVGAYRRDLLKLQREDAQLKRTERGLKAIVARASRAATGGTGRVRSLASKLSQLATYDKFSVKEQKRLVINTFPKSK